MSREPLSGHDLVTTEAAREIVNRPQFPDGRYKGPGGHVAVNGHDLRRVEAEAEQRGYEKARREALASTSTEGEAPA